MPTWLENLLIAAAKAAFSELLSPHLPPPPTPPLKQP